MLVKLGTTIPLYVILGEDDATKVVKCDIIEPRAPSFIEQDITLSPVAGSPGHYHNADVIMTDNLNLIANFVVFESDETTVYGRYSQDITLADSALGGSLVASNRSYSDLVATVDDDALIATVTVEEA